MSKSNIAILPGVERTPGLVLAELMGLADDMLDMVCVLTDKHGIMRVAYSKQTRSDLAAAALILNDFVTRELHAPSDMGATDVS